jgi:RNA polymerase sigma factor (sigma-70 family)
MLSLGVSFDQFAAMAGPRLRAGLVAAYGPEVGADATAEALAYAWEHWQRIREMANPAGYLYRVGQTAARRARRPQGFLPQPDTRDLPAFEPGLLPALEALSELQRSCVVMVHAFGWSQAEVAELLDISPSTVRTHLARGLTRLQQRLEVSPHGN